MSLIAGIASGRIQPQITPYRFRPANLNRIAESRSVFLRRSARASSSNPQVVYDHKSLEGKWQRSWDQKGMHRPDLEHAPNPYYLLMMFPYPSAAGLHMGNVYAFLGADTYARFQRLQGKDVFEPMGFDAFGIHSENLAIKEGKHPEELTAINVANFRRQLGKLGAMFDWSREVNTTDPAYYRWTQWIFLELFKHNLAYRKQAPVNWCGSCKTVVAHADVIEDKHERCDTPVETKDLLQWHFRLSHFGERLLRNLEALDWPAQTKGDQRFLLQKNLENGWDWTISRQRYWGAPIPIIHCKSCGEVAVPEKDLPVLLPKTDSYLPDDSGRSPLGRMESFVRTSCPNCHGPAERATEVLDNFLDSAWYFLRYLSPHEDKRAFDPERLRRWFPMPMYIGGNEHATGHLLYSRFITMALHDLGYLPAEEPFPRFYAHGKILMDGKKMSKSKGNVVLPDPLLEEYGADVLRLYLLATSGDFLSDKDLRDTHIRGNVRYVNRIWSLKEKLKIRTEGEEEPGLNAIVHKTLADVTRAFEILDYTRARICIHHLVEALSKVDSVHQSTLENLAILLAPLAPHLAEELWSHVGHKESIFVEARWPEAIAAHIDNVYHDYPVNVNGKVVSSVRARTGATEDEVAALAMADPKVLERLQGRNLKKTIFQPGRALVFVVED